MTEYLANLQRRDKYEQSAASLINDYSRLADRCASAEAKLLALESGTGGDVAASGEAAAAAGGDAASLLSHLRAELASTRATLATSEKTLSETKAKSDSLEAQLSTSTQSNDEHAARAEKLARHVASLQRRLKDRESEARESRKLLERVQDEMVGLNLEKNVAVQRMEGAEGQLKELEGRLMEWKRKEAEKMNEESKW